MKPYVMSRILVPVDFSDVATNALETAVAICKRQLTTLTLIHVVENTFHLIPVAAAGASQTIVVELMKNANEMLNELAKKLRTHHDIVVTHTVQSGNPADEICTWAHKKDANLIVMGAHGASGLREFFMGSNAYRVVKNAPCPVMTIPGTRTWIDFKKILFPIRMVPNALDKYEVVRPIIRKNGSSMIIAGLIKKDDPVGVGKINTLVESVREKMKEDQVRCTHEVIQTEAVSKSVLKLAEDEKPDLIVITATLDTSLKDFFLGPFTQDIVNHAQFPVLSIRPQASIENAKSAAVMGYA